MAKQYCFIIGTKKGASTSLYEWLTQHPRTARCFKKEPGFFSKDKEWAKGISHFHALFRHNRHDFDYYMDATTDYSQAGFECVPQRMYSAFPDARIVYICRDPFDKMESQTHQFLIDGDTKFPITEGLDTRIVQSLKYAAWLDRYLEFFPKEQVKVVSFSDFKTDPERVLNEVVEFLELEPFEFDTSFVHNRKESALGQSYGWYRALRAVLRSLKITPYIPQAWKDDFRTLIGQLGSKNIPENSYRMSEDQCRQLALELREDVTRLHESWGVDTGAWRLWKYLDD